MNVISGEIGTNLVLGDFHREISPGTPESLGDLESSQLWLSSGSRFGLSAGCGHVQSSGSGQNQ